MATVARSPSIESPDRRAAHAAAARASFVRSRVASFFGFAPLGVWTVVHLWNNLAAFQGPDAWQAAVTEYPHPVAEAVTGIIVLLPLALHIVWGFGRLATSRPNNVRYGFYTNLKYALQRLSAIGVLLFLGAHLWLALLKPRLVEGHAEPFSEISHEMHFHGPTLVVYLLGTLGVAYHLANGTQTMCMTWGLVSSRRGLARLEWASILLFVILLAMSWGAVYALWAGGATS
jgi:succinate dehydrogenase / fumarate reductase cytochrome b subunit